MAKEFSVTRDGTQIISMMLDRTPICSVMRDLRIKQEDARRRSRGMCGFKKELRVCWMEMEVE